MIDTSQIKLGMPLVNSEGRIFATVDHMEGPEHINLEKTAHFKHRVDERSVIQQCF